MHPTIFELRSFGLPRLPAAKGRAILHHLRGGCGRCRAALAPRLIPWMDEGPADEARATEPARCGRTIEAAYLRAAGRAFRAAARPRSATAGDRRVRQALAILDAEGPEAIGRLPRRLLGLPAIEALLRQTQTLGPRDPRLRLRLSELAYDLAMSSRGEPRQLRQARCRATIELANARRVTLDLRSAQQLLDRGAEDLAGHAFEPLLHAYLLEIQASMYCDMSRPVAGCAVMAAAMRLYRQAAQPVQLARALVREANAITDVIRDHDRARERFHQALTLLETEDEAVISSSALAGLSNALLRSGRWQEALEILHRYTRSMALHGRNRARLARIEGEILSYAGDRTGAARAFESSRGELKAMGQPYEAGVVTLTWAEMLWLAGDMEAVAMLISQATESMLALEPHQEVYLALMYLRTANRFSQMRSSLPLDRILEFLFHAQFNPSLRLQSYLH